MQKVKENREGLDYKGTPNVTLMRELDEYLVEWIKAQSKRIHSTTIALERRLEKVVQGHFSYIVKQLQGPDADIAAAALGFSDDVRAIPYLLDMIEHKDPAVRSNAIMSIGHIRSKDTPMEKIYKVLKNDPADKVRAMAAFAIYQIITKDEDEGALPHLLQALKDKSPLVRNNTVIALEKLQNEEAGKALVATTLNDPSKWVQYNTIRALGNIGEKSYIKPLVRKLRSKEQTIKTIAYWALNKITNKGSKFGDDPKKWEEWAGVENVPKKVKNLMDFIPEHNQKFEKKEDGTIDVLYPRFNIWFLRWLKKEQKIHTIESNLMI